MLEQPIETVSLYQINAPQIILIVLIFNNANFMRLNYNVKVYFLIY